ncbi:MAG: hypothetical protein B7Z52_06155 [Burkholderiales bacterium 12-64-5]|nr:MAG: hypothetical protein B7Z52_06155 [Burkholderiales bacterium 12-64-5]
MNPVPGQMMQMPLLISNLIRHAARHHGDTEIVSRRVEGDIHRTTYREAELRSRKFAQALARLGTQPGERIGTLAWNGYRHFEIYYGVSRSPPPTASSARSRRGPHRRAYRGTTPRRGASRSADVSRGSWRRSCARGCASSRWSRAGACRRRRRCPACCATRH